MGERLNLDRPLKVLVVAPSMDTIGGQSIQANLIVSQFRDDPFLEMTFQAINPRLPFPFRPIQRIKYLRTLPTFILYCFQLFGSLRRCDVAHVFSASYSSFLLAPTPAIFFSRCMQKPLILNYHSGEAEDHLTRWPSAIRTLRHATRIVVPSSYLVGVFSKFGLTTRAVFNAVDLSSFPYRLRVNARPAFLVNRNFETHYNVALVLRAFQHIQYTLPDASLTVAGEGPEREPLKRLAGELSLRHVRFIGRVLPVNMPALYDEHDIWLNGSDVDNMPLSILEAFACGLSVITTNAGGIPTLVEDGITGLIANCGDHEALAGKALEVLRNPPLFAKLTVNARSECEKYTWQRIKIDWLEEYAAIAPSGTALSR